MKGNIEKVKLMARDLQNGKKHPRSPRETLGGYVPAARAADKCREYSNANRQAEGAEFISARWKQFDARLTDVQRALYLSWIGLLRAEHSSAVPLLQRIGWVKETISILERAKEQYQNHDPFKFLLYSAKAGQPTPEVPR